jgi:deazaflavin-dependent oxidoreductase (nitroreductase family)
MSQRWDEGLAQLGGEDYCYITTTGRVTGRAHTVEIWFALADTTVYVLAGGRHDADFVRNARKQPAVHVRVGGRTFAATARAVAGGSEEDARARVLVVGKYAPGYDGDLSEWGREALVVAFDLAGEGGV